MYQKPTLYRTEDLAEGVYAASGSNGNTVKFTSNGFKAWYGQSGEINYNVTIPSSYAGEHVILTLQFSKNITNCYGLSGSNSVSGKTATLEIWNAQSGTVTAQSAEGDPGLKSITIRKA